MKIQNSTNQAGNLDQRNIILKIKMAILEIFSMK